MKNFTFILFVCCIISSTACEDTQSGFSPANLTITASTTEILVNGTNTIVLKVTDEKKNDVTDMVDIYLGSEKLNEASYKPTKTGELSFYAKYENISSAALIVNALPEVPTYTKKVLAEDYTGAWCGYCPRIAYKLDAFYATNKKMVAVAIHNGDELVFNKEALLRSEFNVTGFPTVMVNRSFKWSENNSTFDSELQKKPLLGLAIENSVTGSTVNVTVKVGFEIALTAPLNLVVCLLENKVVLAQVNYYNNDPTSPWYQRGNPIADFEHNHVLRKTATDIFGDVIPAAQIKKETPYQKTFSFTIQTEYNINNCEIVAFVMYDNTYMVKSGVLNVQKTKVGTNQAFD